MKNQTADLDPKIAAVMAEWRCGRSLPQAFYGDPDVFRRDVDRVLMRHWLCAGHESQAASPGDYFLAALEAFAKDSLKMGTMKVWQMGVDPYPTVKFCTATAAQKAALAGFIKKIGNKTINPVNEVKRLGG